MKRIAIAAVLLAGLAAAVAVADGPINQVCKSSSIKEWGNYIEADVQDGGNLDWSVQCCGKAMRADGGYVAFLPEHTACETATGSTRNAALSTCRTNWAAKRCP